MYREEMIKMLYAIDAELDQPLKITITGASALILRGSISRATSDIDILEASPDLGQAKYREIIDKIAAKYHLTNNWIDTSPSEMTFKHLPEYRPDLQIVEGDFKFLQPYIISKADSVITKFAYYENIRQWDKKDIKELDFSEADYNQLRLKLDKLSSIDPERALRIEIEFKALKPEFIKTPEGFLYSNSNEIAVYAQQRYGIILEEEYLKQLNEDAQKSDSSVFLKAILQVDYRALETIVRNKRA
ncbi:MAG: hypothetical protein LBI42_09640 [Chitinispirillales bacterium]|jgi:hypothetical protein|nr:hypothetical protein [Chitinispirillales bacterium]